VSVTRAVPGFLPSTSGLHFPNHFARVPVRYLGVPGLVRIPIGDASNGMCGGMAFAALDYFEAERPPPADDTVPDAGPLFEYISRRLFDSFDLPGGPVRYLDLMNPALSDGDGWLARLGLAPHGRAWRMIVQEWPKIRADIDSGRPSPLGVVRIKSFNPFDLKHDHQVLAYGYTVDGEELTLRIYDPNWPDRDDVTISLDVRDPLRPTTVAYSPGDGPVYAFFRVGYRRSVPPA
jgi:hypothetical protein